MSGNRPKITPAQIGASLIAGIPIISNLLAAFGVYTVTPAEQHALTESMTWATAFASLLVLGDAGLRSARNHADAKVAAVTVATVANQATAPDGDAPLPLDDPATIIPDQGDIGPDGAKPAKGEEGDA